MYVSRPDKSLSLSPTKAAERRAGSEERYAILVQGRLANASEKYNRYFVLDLSNEGEDEKDAIVSVKYYVLWIFIELFYRLSEFTILVVILRSVNVLAFADYGIPGAARKARLATLAILCFVGVVSLTTFCLVAGYYGNFADANFDELPSLVNVIVGFFVTYNVLYSVAAIYVVVIAAIGIARTRSKVSASDFHCRENSVNRLTFLDVIYYVARWDMPLAAGCGLSGRCNNGLFF